MPILEAGAIAEEYPVERDFLTPLGDATSPVDAEIPLEAPFSTSTLLRQYFGAKWQNFEKIAFLESGNNLRAYNPEPHNGCNGSYGYFQIACVNYEGDKKDLYDLETNIKTAKEVFDSQGYGAWFNSAKKLNLRFEK